MFDDKGKGHQTKKNTLFILSNTLVGKKEKKFLACSLVNFEFTKRSTGKQCGSNMFQMAKVSYTSTKKFLPNFKKI